VRPRAGTAPVRHGDEGAAGPRPIATTRLLLVPASATHLSAELDGGDALAGALGVRVPDEWPPDLYDRATVEFSLVVAENTPPEDACWLMYYLVLRDDEGRGPTAIGIAGFKGPPQEGMVEIGYSILDAYRRRGYATEAVNTFLRFAFGNPLVYEVTAETYPELVASIGVLENCGFRLVGAGSEEGVIRFRVRRMEWEKRLFAAGRSVEE
jgi:ribosomal-protein-alanine N-acetyltransferase